MKTAPLAALTGVLLVFAYTALISSADAITKLLSDGYAAPQLFAVSGGLVALFSWIMSRIGKARADQAAKTAASLPAGDALCSQPSQPKSPRGDSFSQGLRTTQPVAMAIRCVSTVIAAVAFFYAFHLLAFAEVFVFIGLMPLIAGLMSGPILRETVALRVWLALGAGFIGVACLFPQGLATVTLGHVVALIAAFSGTLSMVMARYVGKHESNSLALVFYPNLTLMITMAAVLPFVFVPMPLGDLGFAALYAAFLFGARWVLVVALRLLPAYVAMPLLNFQFLWMVGIGMVVFHEIPGANMLLGAAIVIASGIYVIYDQLAEPARKTRRSRRNAVTNTAPRPVPPAE